MATTSTKIDARPQLPLVYSMPLSTCGGVVAWLFAHPFELTKNRLMLASANPAERAPTTISVVRDIVSKNGPTGLFNGLSAGISRQIVYATLRLGLYQPVLDAVTGGAPAAAVTVSQRVVAGAVSGSFAAFCSCPVEVALVRMTRASAADRKGLLPTIFGIGRNEGVLAFWKGSTPLICRAAIVGVCQVAFYHQVKAWLKLLHLDSNMSETNQYLVASGTTGLFYSAVTMPVEAARVRMMATTTKVEYGMVSSIAKLFRDGGARFVYRGFVPYAGRCTVHTILSFMVIDTTKNLLGYR